MILIERASDMAMVMMAGKSTTIDDTTIGSTDTVTSDEGVIRITTTIEADEMSAIRATSHNNRIIIVTMLD